MPPLSSPGENMSEQEAQFRRDGFLKAPTPANEPERLKAFFRYRLKSEMNGNKNLNLIRSMVHKHFNCLISAITLFSGESQFVISEQNFPVPESPRYDGFCGHTLSRTDERPMIMLDAQKDWRMAGTATVVGPPGIRSYISCPLRTEDGLVLGTLCVVDLVPRDSFSDDEEAMLINFASLVVLELQKCRLQAQNDFATRLNRQTQEYSRNILTTNPLVYKDQHHAFQTVADATRTTLDVDGVLILDLNDILYCRGAMDGEGTVHLKDQSTSSSHNSLQLRRNSSSQNQFSRRSSQSSQSPFTRRHSSPNTPTLATLAKSVAAGSHDSATDDVISPLIPTRKLSTTVDSTSYFNVAFSDVASSFSTSPSGIKFTDTDVPLWLQHLLPSAFLRGMATPVWHSDGSSFIVLVAYSTQQDRAATFIEGFELEYLQAVGEVLKTVNSEIKARQADTAKSLFISSISRVGALAELLEDADLNPIDKMHLHALQGCNNTLLETVNSVLDFAKISSQEPQERPSSNGLSLINLLSLVEEVLETTCVGFTPEKHSNSLGTAGSFYSNSSNSVPSSRQSELKSSGENSESGRSGQLTKNRSNNVESIINFEGDVEDLVIFGDKGAFSRILLNLLSNSLKFTPHGYIEVSLRRYSQEGNAGSFEIQVADTGKGMTEDYMKDSQGAGIGLGMATVSSIVDSRLLNGQILVNSEENVGTQFRILFDAEIPPSLGSTGSAPLSFGKGLKIALLGFDKGAGQLHHAAVLSSLLGRFGFTVVDDPLAASVANDCVTIVNETPTLTEVPGEVLKRPIILCSSVRTSSELVRVSAKVELAGGTCSLLFKPFGPIALRSTLETALISSANIRNTKSSALEDVTLSITLNKIVLSPSPNQSSEPSVSFHSTASASSAASASFAPAVPFATAGAPGISSIHVLVVEDNSVNMSVLTALLRQKKLAYEEAVNGLEGVELVKARPDGFFDMIFMDLTMPIMNGFEATRQIRALESLRLSSSKSLIVALTGLSSDRDRQEAYEAGVDDYLVKPLPLKVLSALLENYQS